MSRSRIVFEYLHGDCLEKEGVVIPYGGIAIVDTQRKPEVSDLVICRKSADAINQYVKKVKSIDEDIIVETNYLDSSRNFEFKAEVIDGVVLTIFDKRWHDMIWSRDMQGARK